MRARSRSSGGQALLKRQLEQLYDEYGQQLFTCALAVTRGRERAEDAVHDAFCRLMRLRREPENLKAYAFRCVRNAAIDLVRREGHSEPLEEDTLFSAESDPRRAASEREFGERVERALETLGEEERETVVQHLWGDLKFREIAEVRDRSIGTVTSWYRRGLAKLRGELEK